MTTCSCSSVVSARCKKLSAAGGGSLPAERIQRPRPDEPFDDLLRQAGSLDHVSQAEVRPVSQLRVEARLVLLADPLDQ